MYHHSIFYKNGLVSGPTEINHIFIFCLINFISQIKSSWDRNLKSWISVIWLYVSRPRVLSFSRIYPDYFPPPQITEHGQIRNLEIGARQYWGGVVRKTPSRAFHFSIRNFRKTTYAHQHMAHSIPFCRLFTKLPYVVNLILYILSIDEWMVMKWNTKTSTRLTEKKGKLQKHQCYYLSV